RGQLFEEPGIRGRAVESFHGARDAVEIRADADMLCARDLHEMIDVIRDILQRRMRYRMRGVPLREELLDALRLSAIQRLEPCLLRIVCRGLLAHFVGNEC